MPQRNIFKQRGEGVRNPNVTRNIIFGRPLLNATVRTPCDTASELMLSEGN